MNSLFISHGPPDLELREHPARQFLRDLGRQLSRPTTIVAISAHWQRPRIGITTDAVNGVLHDFDSDQVELYRLHYPAPGAPELAQQLADGLSAAGMAAETIRHRGLDHGVWSPLRLIHPEANIPLLQLALPAQAPPDQLLALGETLGRLVDDGTLILGSGGTVHNLRTLGREGAAPEAWAAGFADWIAASITAGDQQAACNYLDHPAARRAHPSAEHLLPLFVAWGAGRRQGTSLFRGFMLQNLAMDAYRF